MTSPYVIRGGVEGRERLRVLSRVMHDTTAALLDRLDLRPGMSCLDAGCGGGDVSAEIARRVGPTGRVVGVDIDDTKLEIARAEAAAAGIGNVTFMHADAHAAVTAPAFDALYARFLLTHLQDPAAAVAGFFKDVRPGGRVAVEDIDFTAHFTYPPSPAFKQYHALYCATVRRRGGDPDIGPRLPSLLAHAGFVDLHVAVAQPVALTGETKLLTPITMQNIVAPVVEDGLASEDEVQKIVQDLYDFAADPTTLMSLPRIVQVCGRRPA